VANQKTARKNGEKGLTTIRSCIAKNGWQLEQIGDGTLRVEFDEQLPIHEAVVEVQLDAQRFIFFLVFRNRVPKRHRQAMMELITRLNFDMVLGSLEMDLDKGVFRFRATLNFAGTPLTEVLVRNLINASQDVVEEYADDLIAVAKGRKTAQQAFKEATGS
jgi:hypothetical protein